MERERVCESEGERKDRLQVYSGDYNIIGKTMMITPLNYWFYATKYTYNIIILHNNIYVYNIRNIYV